MPHIQDLVSNADTNNSDLNEYRIIHCTASNMQNSTLSSSSQAFEAIDKSRSNTATISIAGLVPQPRPMEEIEGMDEDTGMNEDEDMDDCSSSDEPLLLLGAPTASDPAVTPQGSVSLQEHQQVPELRLPHQSDHEHGSATSIRRSRLAIPQVTASYRIPAVGQPISRFQTHTLSRLEVENAFLQNQNDSLNRDIQHCRQTVHALKRILAQKEDVIQRMQEEYRQAYMKTKFMESVLAEHHNISFSGSGKLQQASIKDSGSATVFKVQDEQRLGALLKEAAYKDMDDRNRSLGNSQYGMLGHSYDPDEDEEDEEDEEDDFSSNYSDNSEEEDSEADETEEVEEVKENEGDEDSEGYAPAPHHRFRDLAYDRLSYDAHTLTVASEVVAPAVYTGEQYTSSFDSSTAGPTSAPVGPRQTLRRRPRLQLNLDVQNLVSPHLSSIHSPQDGSPAMPFSESEHCSGSLRSTAVGEMDSVFHDDDHYDNNQELATGKRDRIVLRDSGHFPTEFSPLDNHDDPYDDKLALRVDATTILTSEAGSEAQFPSVTAKDSRHNSAPHSNSHTFVEAGPLSNALLVTRCIQTQTSASFSDTTASETQTDNSHEDAQGSYGDTNPFGRRSNDSSTTVPAAGGDNADDAGDGDEGRSEFSVSTMISPMTEAQDLAETVSTSTAFTDVVQPYVGVSSAEGESRKTLKGHISEPLKLNEKEVPSSSLSFRFPSGMKHKVLLGRSRSKTMSNAMRESCHGRAEKKADAAAVSPTALLMTESTEETEFMSSPFSLTATGSLILLDSVDLAHASATRLRSTTAILSRIWSGLGRQTAGLFGTSPYASRSRDPKQVVETDVGDSTLGTDVFGDAASRAAADPATVVPLHDSISSRKNAGRMTGKGIGVRRLGSRSRSRSLVTSGDSSVS